jgi:hypothetical protein
MAVWLFLLIPGCGGSKPGQILDKFVREYIPVRTSHPIPFGPSEPAILDYKIIIVGRQKKGRRKGPRSKDEIAQERKEILERTIREIDEIVAEYHYELPRSKAESIGAAYARYSTRFQDSIADQIREIFKQAVRLKKLRSIKSQLCSIILREAWPCCCRKATRALAKKSLTADRTVTHTRRREHAAFFIHQNCRTSTLLGQ